MKQKDAVFAVLEANKDVADEKARCTKCVEDLASMLCRGEVEYKKTPAIVGNEKACVAYARQLIANWSKKDERLNGGVKYTPATHRGPQVRDENLKKLNGALKSLQTHGADEALIAKTNEAIEARKTELAAQKAAKGVMGLDEAQAVLAELGIDIG